MRRHPGPPDALLCGLNESDDNGTIDVPARTRVGLPPLFCEVTGYTFQVSHCLHTLQPVEGDKQRKRSDGVVGGMPPSTSYSSNDPPSADTFLMSSSNEIWHMCSLYAYRENYQSHFSICHGLRGHPSIPWPLELAWLLWLLWLWTWEDFPLASSRRNL